MMLMETFDSQPVELEWSHADSTPTYRMCWCVIDGQRIKISFRAASDTHSLLPFNDKGWEISFGMFKYKMKDGEDYITYRKTGLGNQYAIFSAVMQAYKELFGNKEPNIVYMEADEDNRRRLYLRMARRFMTNRDIRTYDKYIIAKKKGLVTRMADATKRMVDPSNKQREKNENPNNI